MMENKGSLDFWKTAVVISLIVNVLLAFGVFLLYYDNAAYRVQFQNLAEENRGLNREILSLKQSINLTQEQLGYYKKQAEFYSRLYRTGEASESIVGYSTTNIVAVRQVQVNPFQIGYKGIVLSAEIELQHGEGRTLINTRPKIGIDMQTSLRTAVNVVENLTGVSLESTDVVLTITGIESAEIVDGPSAGAAVASALMAAITNASLSSDAFITGTINPDGSIGKVGGILEKANASARQGARLFIVPLGQSIVIDFKPKVIEPIPGFTIVTYDQYQIDLNQYLKEAGFKTEVIEVSNIEEAYRLLTASP